jgi:nucleotide-binding universal stress UspA family protein
MSARSGATSEAHPGVAQARLVTWLALLAVVLGAGLAGFWTLTRLRHNHAVVRLLESPAADSRKQGAWVAARERIPEALGYIDGRLTSASEEDRNVREMFVYALGRSGRPEYFETVARVVRQDPDPYVRQSAWLAAARLDPARFRQLARREPPLDGAWDRIGRASAWLETGEVRQADITLLLERAAAGDLDQKRVCSLMLFRTVAPLLEAVGRWPIEYSVHQGEPWPDELVAEVERRCHQVDLAAVAEDTRPHLARAAAVRREVGRLNNTREEIASLVLGG